MTTPLLGLPELTETQASKYLTHNEALRLMEGASFRILDRDLTAPPGGESEGDSYLVGASATSAWAGQDGKVAVYVSGSWSFVSPFEGLSLWVADEDIAITYDGSAWVTAGAELSDNPSISAGAVTLDLDVATHFEVTLDQNLTSITISNAPPAGKVGGFTLKLTQDATGGRTVTWLGSISWVSGYEPSVASAANAVSIFTFISYDGGTTWYGAAFAVAVPVPADPADDDKVLQASGGAWSWGPVISSYGATLTDDADAAAARTTLGLDGLSSSGSILSAFAGVAGNAGMELGPTGLGAASATAFFDFHTGFNNDRDVRIAATGGTNGVDDDGVVTISAKAVQIPSGTAPVPSLAAAGDTDTGLYWGVANQIKIACAGADVAEFDSSQVDLFKDLRIQTTTPSILLEATGAGENCHIWFRDATPVNRGLVYWDEASDILVVRAYDAAGTTTKNELKLYQTYAILASELRVNDGSAALPGFAYHNEPSTGVYRVSAGVIGIATGGTLRVAVDANGVRLGSASGPMITSGAGSPEGVVTAPVGSLYTRTDGGAGTTLYVKESGAGNTGWVAK